MKSISNPTKPFYRRDPITVIVLTILVYLVSQFVGAILIGVYPGLRNWTSEQADAWLQTVQAQFVFVTIAEALTIFLIFKLIKRAGVLKSRIGLVKPQLRDVGLALAVYAVYFVTYLIIIMQAQFLIPGLNTEQKQQIGFEDAYSSLQLFATFLSLVVIVPFTEEVMFRGYLFSGLRAKLRLRYAIVITSVIFGVLHLQFGSDAPLLWVAAIDTFVLSCFLCYLRERTGSIWAGVLVHALKNSVAFMLLFGSRIF